MAHKIRFMETILRDGQQSQIATRMPIEDMVPILEPSIAAVTSRLRFGAARRSIRACAF